VRLGALVTPLARRRPQKVARETASLDLLSEGRLVFGAGLGSRAEEEFAVFGDEPDPKLRAAMLDEGLEVLAGLWSGEPFDFKGEHFKVGGARFLPTPLQKPRPPVWIAGRWPAKRPFRRAAQWDGVFPIIRGAPHEETMPPELLREIVAYTLQHRPSHLGPLDVVMEGNSEGDRAALRDYKAAGLSWYVEKLGWWRGGIDRVREQIHRGPPET
jgi:alkanesulfonate monooxygenase SsuD/methylene tetrahydromethanopterin reductase-like flavin-dependent oxidoreductase (luciferase family)